MKLPAFDGTDMFLHVRVGELQGLQESFHGCAVNAVDVRWGAWDLEHGDFRGTEGTASGSAGWKGMRSFHALKRAALRELPLGTSCRARRLVSSSVQVDVNIVVSCW